MTRTRRTGGAPSVAVIGAGLGGIGLAIRLKQAGFRDLALFEKEEDVGGPGRAETHHDAARGAWPHPGQDLSMPAASGSPRSEPRSEPLTEPRIEPRSEPQTEPQIEPRSGLRTGLRTGRRSGPLADGRDVAREFAARFGVLAHIRFGAEVRGAAFDEATGRWLLTFGDGTSREADLVVAACGQLIRPASPASPTPAGVAGRADHPAPRRSGHRPAERRVAVVGTGTNAIQFVPQIVPDVAHLSLFPFAGHLRPPLSVAPVRTRPRLAGRPAGRPGRRRVLLTRDRYPSLEDDCVAVVAERVAQVRPDGLVTADGALHEADTIIFATAFTAAELLAPMAAAAGRGQDLRQVWRDAGSYLWLSVAGFPNLFVLYGQQERARRDRIRAGVPAPPRRVVRAAGVR